jgi:hypothetical protein
MIVGAMVRMTGICGHRASGLGSMADVRECFHQPGMVSCKFQDGLSFWVRNRHGFARRIAFDNLKAA